MINTFRQCKIILMTHSAVIFLTKFLYFSILYLVLYLNPAISFVY